MQRPAGETDLPPADRAVLRDVVDRFERAGAAGPVDLAAFLPPPADRLYPLALRELVRCDIEVRYRGGRPVRAEEYLRRFPDLRGDAGWLTRLLFEEYSARRRHGDAPVLADYRYRFPDQFEALERLVHAPESPTDPMPPQLAPAVRESGSVLPVFGGYKLVKRIGSGSFGEVWQAEAPGGVEAAIKVIIRPLTHAEAKKELESLELMKRLRHPFLLQTQAFWPLEDRLLIAMELADGSVRDRLNECTAAGLSGIPVEELLVYTREACEALDFLHGHKVLHRDIKPDNILLLQRHVKVADFGLARVLQAQRARMTVAGTPAFMPPEMWMGKACEQSDLYSLAGSYSELRLNRHLFQCDDMAAAMMAHYQQTPDLDPLPAAEQQVLLRALAKDPEKRFDTCRAFWEALRQAVAPAERAPPAAADGGPPARPTTGAPGRTLNLAQLDTHEAPVGATLPAPGPGPARPMPGVRRRPAVVAAVLAAAALAGAAVAVGLVLRPRDATPDVYVPDGFHRAGDAGVVEAGGRTVYERIAFALPDRTDLEFALIPQSRPTDPESFYMLRDKVTNQAFAQFDRDNPGAVKDGWKLGAAGENDIPLGIDESPFHPVMRASVDEAHRFAGWLKGRLPTAREWDKAAGRFDGAVGPFAGDGHSLRPEDLGVAGDPAGGSGRLRTANRGSPAVTLFGCRDMAGNGYEWTCSTRGDENERVPFDDPAWNDRVSVRGQTYFAPSPYRFADRPNSRYRFQNPQNGEPGASPEVGFRVAVEFSRLP